MSKSLEEIHRTYYNGKRVLITGGAGFRGSHLADRLAEYNAEIIIVDDLSSGRIDNLFKSAQNSSFVKAHFGAIDSFAHLTETVTHAFHCVLPSDTCSGEKYQAATARLYKHLAAHACTSLIYASSTHVYTPQTDHTWKESDPITDLSQETKAITACEQYGKALGEQRGINVGNLRATQAYGQRMQKHSIYNAFTAYASFISPAFTPPLPTSFPTTTTPIAHLVTALLHAGMCTNLRGHIVNIGSIREFDAKKSLQSIHMSVHPASRTDNEGISYATPHAHVDIDTTRMKRLLAYIPGQK